MLKTVKHSGNKKTGPIAVTYATGRAQCVCHLPENLRC
jgi:hypothetical protein